LLWFVCHKHNKIQLFGYEAANILLVCHQMSRSETLFDGFGYEALAALAFIVGSICIYSYHPGQRPAGLFYGGLSLGAGGLLLVGAGYSITGFSVVLASMETARGGLLTLKSDLARSDRPPSALVMFARFLGTRLLGFYIAPINGLCRRFGRLGQFLNDRPFLVGTLIKFPLRLEFIIMNLLRGDLVGVVVGLSWMILGDGALAFNDQQLRRSGLRLIRT
jgi:hypothetical protein